MQHFTDHICSNILYTILSFDVIKACCSPILSTTYDDTSGVGTKPVNEAFKSIKNVFSHARRLIELLGTKLTEPLMLRRILIIETINEIVS